jgi:hypothetical protein
MISVFHEFGGPPAQDTCPLFEELKDACFRHY